ncbi:MAG: hypothetical protein AB1635_16630 [Acidobacteriota bacterium]
MATAGTVVVAGALALGGWTEQPEPDLDDLLARLGEYLVAYEGELSTVIASERYDQRETLEGNPNDVALRRRAGGRSRRLESDVAFLRLPGHQEWLGLRDVRKVDGREVPGAATRLADLVRAAGDDVLARADAIVAAGAEHNLGGPRSINMPSAPLEVLHPRHFPRFIFTLTGRDRIQGVATVRMAFEEFETPSLIQGTEGGDLLARGTVWVEAATGCLWRVELRVTPVVRDMRMRERLEQVVRVDFARDAAVGLVVPSRMTEEFYVPGGRGIGEARYTNYRRFTTGARLVPPPGG